MPIGPALPPHLAHLSRASDKSAATEAEAGPSVPRSTTPPVPACNDDEDEEEEEDDYGPALPPQLAAKRQLGPMLPPPSSVSAGPSRPSDTTSGPQYQRRGQIAQQTRHLQEEESDSDDDIGPRPISSSSATGGAKGGDEDEGRSAIQEFKEREARWAREREEAANSSGKGGKVMKREEWMLVPPKSGILAHGEWVCLVGVEPEESV